VVVSPAFADAEFGGAEQVREAPDGEDIEDWFDRTNPALVVAATDDGALNEAIAEAANERGILVNQTDASGERDAGSVVVPATVEDGPVTMAVSTDGDQSGGVEVPPGAVRGGICRRGRDGPASPRISVGSSETKEWPPRRASRGRQARCQF